MASLFDFDPEGARQQSLFAALLAAAPQLMAAGAPSTQPGSWGRGMAAFGPQFVQTQQGYLGNQQNMALRALQMKKLQEEIAQQEAWRQMWSQPQMGQSQAGLFDTQGGEMVSEPKPQSLFENIPRGAGPFLSAMGPEKGSAAALKMKFPQMDPTAPMQNFAHRNELVRKFGEGSPEVNRFDNYVRANPWLNLGGEMVLPNPSQPGSVTGVLPKSVPPEQLPALKGAQEKAKTIGGVAGKREANMADIGQVIDRARNLLTGEETGTKPTGSWIGTGVDIAGSVFGASPSGAKEADALKAVSGSLVSSMPRMEGPQSDRDTALYREMAGQVGDPTLPVERRLFALKEVERLWRKYGRGEQAGPTVTQPQADPLGLFTK